MIKRNKMLTGRVRNLVALSAMTAIILSVSTYAWFIGMRTVNVTSFDVEIKTTDSLLLSLNGSTWSSSVSINEDNLAAVSYAGHTNRWSQLIPMSSVGAMDSTYSRMIMYEKASLTASDGGYRLLASRVNNFGTYTEDPDGGGPIQIGDPLPEVDGYVAFDLFVRNYSGAQYITGLNPFDEEAIYLTTDSKVDVQLDGLDPGIDNTGIENSVRVAFAQIGRVIGTETTANTITGITCTTAGSVTGICRTAQIWEPNDTDHVANAISWYTTSCKKRTGANTYAGACEQVVNGTAYDTYAVSEPINSSNNVDVYDGADYNTYDDGNPSTTWLEAYDYFTDSDKIKLGTLRPSFMTLAPNSITKVRVYVYIEGQDVDNYDFASIGHKIKVNFGFTKERFIESDIDYDGPANPEAPTIILTGANPQQLQVNDPYAELGATASDVKDGIISGNIVIDASKVNMTQAGTYTVTYTVTDSDGYKTVKNRTVEVQ